MLMSSLTLLASLVGCDRNGLDQVPQPNDAFPSVVEIGKLEVMSLDQYNLLAGEGSAASTWCNDTSPALGRETVGDRDQEADLPLCYYGQVGLAEIGGETGGATLTFEGTGGDVCLVVDPETVFWNQAVASGTSQTNFSYPDREEDDGDIDMYAGLSAYYTGSPGVEIGDFTGFYTDSLGNQIAIEYGLCTQVGSLGQSDAHSGRATTEFCTIDTSNHVGVEFTVVLETFSVPLDDGLLSFGVMAREGSCAGITECSLLGESLNEDGSVRDCTPQLEAAFCGQDALEPFCCLHPDMCGEDASIDECESALDDAEVSNLDELESIFCGSNNCCN
ncbi:MAG: hypothetical protein ACI8RZ_003463 [Myxococcota bacterium]|jgi:hypothetical protein